MRGSIAGVEAGSGEVQQLVDRVQQLLLEVNGIDHRLASRLYLDVLDSRHEHLARRISETELITELGAVQRHAEQFLAQQVRPPGR